MSWTWPPWWITGLWCVWVFQAAWCAYNLGHALRRVRNQGKRPPDQQIEHTPPAVIIVPIKGVDAQFDQHVASLLSQDYPAYRVIFVVGSEDDPAWQRLEHAIDEHEPSQPGCTAAELRVAGPAEDTGQKVHNLLHALTGVTEADEVVVFADADAVPDSRWLARMTWPMCKRRIGVTTGYRWLVPSDGRLASRIGSVINASVATLAGPDRRNHVWGGSAAIRRGTLEQCRLIDYWRGAISDDYQMTRAVRRETDQRVYFVARCLVGSPVGLDWSGLFSFGRRQYLITRIYAPGVWLIALLGTGLYTAGFISALAGLITGHMPALLPIAMVYFFDWVRARTRRVVVGEVFGQTMVNQLRPAFVLERWATPLWMAIHLLIVLSSAWGRRITWAGIVYEMRGRQDVRILNRAAEPTVHTRGPGSDAASAPHADDLTGHPG